MLSGATQQAREISPKGATTLSQSLGQLRSITDEIGRREKFLADVLKLLNERLKLCVQSGAAVAAALNSTDIAVFERALHQYEGKPDHSEALRGWIKQVSREQALRVQRDMVLSQHKEARDALQHACELRLEQAQDELGHITKDEQARLNSLGEGFDAAASPVVTRAVAKVEHLKGMLQRIDTDNDFAAYFVNFAEQLLNE